MVIVKAGKTLRVKEPVWYGIDIADYVNDQLPDREFIRGECQFLEPAEYRGGETDPFHPKTLWLRKTERETHRYVVEE